MNHDLHRGLSSSNLDLRRRAALGAIAVLCAVLATLILLSPKAGAPEIVTHDRFPPTDNLQLQAWGVQDEASLDANYLLQSWPDFGSTMTATIAWPQQPAPQDVESIAKLR